MKLSMNLPKIFVLIFLLGGAGALAWKLFDPGGGAAGNIGQMLFGHLRLRWHVSKFPVMLARARPHRAQERLIRMMTRIVDVMDEWRTLCRPAATPPMARQTIGIKGHLARGHRSRKGRDLVSYVRALQEANGIVYKPHRM